MTYAIPADVEVVLGRVAESSAETAQWQAWLDTVERAITRAFRRAGLDLATQIAAGDPTADDVKDVEVSVVVRKIQNPTWGLTSKTESHQIDDGSASITTRNDGPGAYIDPLALTVDDLAALLPSGSGGAFSIRPYYEPDTSPTEWLG